VGGVLIVVGIALGACSDDDDSAGGTTTGSAPSTESAATTVAETAADTTAPSTDAAATTVAPVRPAAPLPTTFPPFSGPPCESSAAGSLLITADCVDPDLVQPYVDVDEQRQATDRDSGVTVSYRYVHGGFADTEARFSLYFPSPEDYAGRFFHTTYPTISQEDTDDGTIAFGVSHGAYVVSANNAGGVAVSPALGGYRVNAATARFSKIVAQEIYGGDAPIRGYLYGASGGAYQTIGGMENTSGIWDGGVPMVPGVPNAIPSFQVVQLLAMRVLGDKLQGVSDALEPGGSGDPYAGLDDEQRAILDEVTMMGYPPRGWWQYGGEYRKSFFAVQGGVRSVDATYVDDFWSLPGYAGTDPSSSVGAARVQFETTVTATGENSVTLGEIPEGELFGADLVLLAGPEAGEYVSIDTVEGNVAMIREESSGEVLAAIAAGDPVRIDNSWVLALEYYHRHQVPTPDMYGWNQFRDAAGTPIYPQRPVLFGPIVASTSGGVATGRFDGKMIMLASVLDTEAFPWSADWYHQQALAAFGDGLDDNYRLWFSENAEHVPPRDPRGETFIVSYGPMLQQALLDLDAWVLDGTAPPANSSYTVSDRNQIDLADTAAARLAVQPVVTLRVDEGEDCAEPSGEVVVDVAAGDAVSLTMATDVPPGAGDVVRVEWDFEGTGEFADESEVEVAPSVGVCETHTYDEPGTYFAVVRVTSQRAGDTAAPFGLIQNLARVRVVVG
jgi:hypothetical protein